MRDMVVEQKRLLLLHCYKWLKFRGTPDEICPWGRTEVGPACKHCRWIGITKVAIAKGKPAVTERILAQPDSELSEAKVAIPDEYLRPSIAWAPIEEQEP